MSKLSPKTNNPLVQFGFFAICAMLIAIVVNQTTSLNKSFDTRSRAAGCTAPIISNFSATAESNQTAAVIRWASNVPTTSFLAWDTTNTTLLSNDPNAWGRFRTNTTQLSTSHVLRVTNLDPKLNYFFRSAGRTQPATGCLGISSNVVLMKRPNCCGYNNAMQQWYCYTGCMGYNPSATSIYPTKTCTTVAQCK